MLEGGVLAGALILGYLALFVRRLLRAQLSTLQRMAGCSIFLLLIHSLIDYPLRTMAMGVLFAFLNAIYFRKDPTLQHVKN